MFANHFLFLGIGIYCAVVIEAAPVMHYLHVAQVRVVSVVTAPEATDRRISAAALSFLIQRTQPHHRRVLRFPCALWSVAWISASTVSHHISTLCGQNAVWGLLDKKEVIPIAGDDLDFQIFCADRLAAVWVPSLSLGGRGKPRSFRFRPSLRSGGFTFSTPLYDNRCRSRCSRPRTRARSTRTSTTGTGTSCKRCNRAGSHGPTSCQKEQRYL